jgi:hypothetical protein
MCSIDQNKAQLYTLDKFLNVLSVKMQNIEEISLLEPDKADDTLVTLPPELDKPEQNESVQETVEENGLEEILKKNESTLSELRNEIAKKTDVLLLLENQKGALEKEVTHVSATPFLCNPML